MSGEILLLHASDPHGDFSALSGLQADILAVTGDLSATGSRDEILTALDAIARLSYPRTVLIGGNHDRWAFDHWDDFARECAARSVDALFDSAAEACGLRFHGMPWITWDPAWKWSKNDSAWAFSGDESPVERKLSLVAPGVDVLLTHAPPRGIGDRVSEGTYFAGVGLLEPGLSCLRAFAESRNDVRAFLFGHVHGNPGVQFYQGKVFSNAARGANRLTFTERSVTGACIARL